ncbi:unnamed protein product [Macrosiphum euphorbiae]|uniref:RNA-directed DNA polymerase n=2 Tax=Macrosiphum euphorbiae TaxID=13131 RepID=A0AAV0WP02_9HEMI|nr:unnamed protein product [Macrosiphum euphorbiae]
MLKSFLGLVTYYIKFVPRAADILKPLYSLLRQEKKWLWSPECDQAYNNIKKMLISSPVLAHYDQKLPIKLTVDSSSYALGAIISHTYPDHSERPIAYASRVLSSSECKFPQIEKEGLAIIFGVQKFYDYLYGRKFTFVTGHKPLIHIFGEKKGIPIYAANRLQRWAYVLSSFDFEIKYIKSEGNTADFLSRIKTNQCNNNINEYDDAHINFIHEQSPFPLDWHKIKIETKRDPITSRVLHATKTGSWSNDFSINSELNSYNTRKTEITVEQDCLFWGYRVIIPTKFRMSILTELHSCHIGMSSMKSIARSYFWWPSIDKEIEDMVRNCNECISARPNPPKSVLTPWKWPQRQWTRVHCDFLGPYKNKTFLIIVDATTKWLEVFQVNSMTAQTVITKLSELIARFGIPRTITTDNAKCFNGDEFQSYCKTLGIRHLTGAPFHPASNGFAESGVKIVKQFFNKCSTSLHHLNKFLLMYRNTVHSTTNETPAKLMFGRSTRKRDINIKEGDLVLVKDYRNKNENWQKGKITENISKNTHKIILDEGSEWIRHTDQIWPHNQINNSLSPTPARQANENSKNTETVGENQNPDPADPVIVNKTPRPFRSRKPPQRYSPSDYA